jgi:hypothetical protein
MTDPYGIQLTRAGQMSQEPNYSDVDMLNAIEASLADAIPIPRIIVPRRLIEVAQNARIGPRIDVPKTYQELRTWALDSAWGVYKDPLKIVHFTDDISLQLRMHILETFSDETLEYIIIGFKIYYNMTSNEEATREFGKRIQFYTEMKNYRAALRLQIS